MKGNISIQLKAAFLIMVFSMNTIIGFAFALGVDMGFNSKHHHDHDEEVHVDCKEQQHNDEETKHHHESKEDSEKGGCCNEGVIKFQNLEKNLNQNNTQVIYVHVFVTMLSNFWSINIFNCDKALPQQYKVSVFHPPPTDILIAIQRFQI
jgi:ABC-type nickel/cobalt efflux system permease component RcnA